MIKPRRFPARFAIVASIALLSASVWAVSYRAALIRLHERADIDLEMASDRLTGHLLQFRELAVVLADHPALGDLLSKREPAARTEALLLEMADKTGAHSIALVDRSGAVLARSADDSAALDPARPPLARALNGALGTDHRLTSSSSDPARRLFLFAAPIHAGSGPPLGAVVVTVNVRSFEQNWPTSAAAVYFSDATGRVFVANRSELVRANLFTDDTTLAHRSIEGWTGQTLWQIDGGPYLPRQALHLARDLPIIGLSGAILADTAPARGTAILQTAVFAAVSLAFATFFVLATERRRALSDRLAFEAAANARLESRVQERTRALSRANRDLRREIREREDAEAALRAAQAELVQAGKLSALGRMSAGISHELNQPLMAIRSFADNGVLLADKGDTVSARDNLARISELARRMGRIIRNLRAFARQEHEPIGDVDLVQVVDAALDVCAGPINDARVDLHWTRPQVPVLVRGGEVRLQQVVTNLVSNAVEAMSGQSVRRLDIAVSRATTMVTLSVTDTGPGIREPERVFDPFYSTKQVGSEDGMGLGLSISYGLVQSFGGAIRGENRDGGGAVFTMELNATAEEAAT